jgi:NADH-quinone oxidoreductase subunit D
MDVAQAVTGQRVVHDAIAIGGVACDATEKWSSRVASLAEFVQAAVHQYVREGELLQPLSRLEGLAPVHTEDMRGWGLSGPLLRATRVSGDARADGRCRSYRDVDLPVVTREGDDGIARMELRLLEMAASAKVLKQMIRGMTGGRVSVATPQVFPNGSGLGVVEDPRGEVMCYIVSDGSDRPRRVRWRSPDLAHAAALGDLLIGCPEDDVALAVASIDICTGGIDR